MELTYELTQMDFYESIVAHRTRSTTLKWAFRIVSISLVVGAGLLILAVCLAATNLASVAPIVIIAVGWLAVVWFLPRLAARTQYRKQPGAHGPKTVVLDDTGVHLRWDGGSADVQWKTYFRHLESKHQFLLYSSPVTFNMLPKRALTPEQVCELRAFLQQKLPRR